MEAEADAILAVGPWKRLLRVAIGPPDDLRDDASRERARRVAAASLLLCVMWIAAAVVVPLAYPSAIELGAGPLTLILVSPAIASILAYGLSRSRYTLAAAGAAAAIAAVGTLVAAMYRSDLAAPVSGLFLFASLLVLGVLFLPLLHATALAAANLLSAVAIPHWLPQTGPTALEIPYVFLALNAVAFAVFAPLRQRDERAVRLEHDRAETATLSAQAHASRAEALAETSRSKEAQLRAASHEVQTPVTILRLQLELLRRNSAKVFTPAQEKNMAILERNVTRLGTLVSNLMDHAKLEADRLALSMEDVDVGVSIQEAADSFRDAADGYGVRLEVEPTHSRVRADPLRLSQVLYNLLSNALKHTPTGGRVRLLAQLADGALRVTVEDTGPGLTPDQIGQLFQPFQRVHQAIDGRGGGTGLGLSISQRLVEAHGGRLWAESDGPGLGSRFRFTLPLAGAAAPSGP